MFKLLLSLMLFRASKATLPLDMMPMLDPAIFLSNLANPNNDIIITNPRLTGDPRCAGLFTGGANINYPGFPNQGIILSSGLASDASGPNDHPDETTEFGTPGDTDLDNLTGLTTKDACVLEFDFTCPVGTFPQFRYVFSSDEYLEYVATQYNDVFGWFLNGANIALLPDGVTPVSINTVNPGANGAFYVDNNAGNIDLQADGMTTVLTASGAGVTGTNTMKLAIADTSDEKIDAWVFLQSGSFECKPRGGGGYPDPHFKTWAGTKFDYHGKCDLVYLQSPTFGDNQGLDIHLRTAHETKKDGEAWSSISNVAVKIGKDVFEVSKEGTHYINGEADASLPAKLMDQYAVSKTEFEYTTHWGNTYSAFNYEIDLGLGQVFSIVWWNTHIAFELKGHKQEDFEGMSGLVGSWRAPHLMIGRDGETDYSDREQWDAFGEQWQVQAGPSLFSFTPEDHPQHPEVCTPAKPLPERRLRGDPVRHRRAKEACAHVGGKDAEDCMFDVMLTGDASWSEAPWYRN